MRSPKTTVGHYGLMSSGGLLKAVSGILLFTVGVLLLVPPNLAYSRPLPLVASNRLGQYFVVSDTIKKMEWEEIKVADVKENIVSDYLYEGTFQKPTGAKSVFIPSPVAVLRDRPRWIVMEKEPTMLVPFKLRVLAEALINQNVRGLAKLKIDEFTSAYLAAIGMELYSWMEDNGSDVDFINTFKIPGPWILVFTPMSPTSMHEYMDSLDLPSDVGDALDAHRLPTDMILWQRGQELMVGAMGAEGMNLVFKVSEDNQVTITNPIRLPFNRE